MTEEAIVVIACVRVSAGGPNFEAEAYKFERSIYTRVPCPGCSEQMYLGNRSRKFLEMYPGKAKLMCSECATEIAAKADVVGQTNFAQFDPPSD